MTTKYRIWHIWILAILLHDININIPCLGGNTSNESGFTKHRLSSNLQPRKKPGSFPPHARRYHTTPSSDPPILIR